MSLKQSAVFFDLAEARDQGVYSGGGEDGGLGFGDEGTHGGSGEGSRLESPGRRESSIPAKPRPTRGRPMKPGSIGGTLTIRCVLWQEALRRIRLVHGEDACEGALQDGLKVALRCRVQFYRDRAQLSLVVEDLDPSYTKGALALMREKLLKELRAKGLDRANGSLEFPDFPFVVGLISAEGSRAYSDFTHQLEVLGFPGHVVFCPSPMQGDGVPQGVCRALELLVQRGCDVIVVTRGGGSAADLRWFDDRDIAYAIAQCSIPVIAAIGHHDDRCVAEEVCYQRQKTPTAAADFLMAVFQGALSRIDEAHRQLLRGLTRRREGFVQETARLGEKMGRLVGRALEARSQWLADRKNSMERLLLGSVAQAQTYGSQLEAKIAMAVERRLSLEHQQIGRIREQIVKADPRPWLAQGWTQLQDLSGRSLRSVAAAHQGQMVRARLLDGVLKMEIVERIEIDSEDQGQGTLR